MAAIVRKQTKRSKRPQKKSDMSDFDLTQESGKKNDTAEGETPVVDRLAKKRPAADFEEQVTCAVGKGVQSMMEKFGTDINKVMQAKRKRLESLTKNFMKGSQHTLEQRWNNQYTQRQKLTQQYSQQVSSALQLWESDTQRIEDQQEKLNNLFRQQQELFQQAKVAQTEKLKIMRELYEQFVQDIEEMEKCHEAYVQGAQQELKKELACLLKKSLMDMQQEQMATVRNSLRSTLF